MKFGMREAVEMYEALRDTACIIDHFSDYINHCQDLSLRQILENQQRRMVEDYQHKAGVMQGHGMDISNIPRFQSTVSLQQGGPAPGMAGIHGAVGMAGVQGAAGPGGMQGAQGLSGMPGGGNIQFGMQSGLQSGQLQAQQQAAFRIMNDRTIARGALLFHKGGATRATAAALESADPHLRSLAANSARNCMDMAHEIFRYMEQRGFYQTPEMPRHAPGGQAYPGMQQQGYQAGAQGHVPGQH